MVWLGWSCSLSNTRTQGHVLLPGGVRPFVPTTRQNGEAGGNGNGGYPVEKIVGSVSRPGLRPVLKRRPRKGRKLGSSLDFVLDTGDLCKPPVSRTKMVRQLSSVEAASSAAPASSAVASLSPAVSVGRRLRHSNRCGDQFTFVGDHVIDNHSAFVGDDAGYYDRALFGSDSDFIGRFISRRDTCSGRRRIIGDNCTCYLDLVFVCSDFLDTKAILGQDPGQSPYSCFLPAGRRSAATGS